MIPVNMKIGVLVVIFALSNLMSYFKGASVVQARFDAFKSEVAAAGKVQAEANKKVIAQYEQTREAIEDEYETRLSALRKSYAQRVREPSTSGSRVSSNTQPSKGASQSTANDGLALRCAETTLQLVELQRWYAQVSNQP